MVKVNFNTADFQRQVSNSGQLILRNRYFEQNPSLTDDSTALIARPGKRILLAIGNGPINGMASEAGSFGGDSFVASGDSIFRVSNTLSSSLLYTGLNNAERGVIRMAITATIGTVPEYLFVADGTNLFVYIANGYARNTLTGTPANADIVRIDDVYYQFTSGSVNAGSPSGTAGNPWLVALGATASDAFSNLAGAINLMGNTGVDYSSATIEHPTVEASQYFATGCAVRSKLIGALGNATITTETGAALLWSDGGTLTGGGSPTFSVVQVPDDVGAIDVAVINSFVIVIPVQSNGNQGKFYWIEPGEILIDPINFATAERSPDGLYGVQVFGDQFWLLGESTTEVWYVSGGNPADPLAPVMQRLQGVVLDRGSWQNTARAVHETLVQVDPDGGVFLVRGGTPERISTPDIEEQIRIAIQNQTFSPLT